MAFFLFSQLQKLNDFRRGSDLCELVGQARNIDLMDDLSLKPAFRICRRCIFHQDNTPLYQHQYQNILQFIEDE